MEFKLESKTYNIMDIIKIPFKASKIYSLLLFVFSILNGVVPTLQVIVTAKFLDVAILIFKGERDYSDIFMYIALIMILIAYVWISNNVIKMIETKLEIKLRESFKIKIIEKRAKLKYKYIENEHIWDLISRVSKDAESKCKNAYRDLLSMSSMVIRVLGLLIVLFTKVWWTPFTIVLVSVPLFKVALKGGKATYNAERKVSKYKRKFEYLSDVLLGRDCVDERILFGYTNKINENWKEQYEIARKIEYKEEVKWFIKMKCSGILTAILSILIILVFIKPVLDEKISIGLFISISNAVFALIQMMSWELTNYSDQLARNAEYLKDLDEFVKLDESDGAIDKPYKKQIKVKSLEFKNVSFKYPETNNYVLKNLSFVIEEGKHYAFVGTNGAGKSTIIKLITGLYEEFEGDILINQKSINEYTKSELKVLTSVVWQDFSKYYISIKDNIALGNINNMGKEDKYIEETLKTIGLYEFVKKLSKGLNTVLGKIKNDGIDLSGGQWQRIGIARAVVSNASLKILDEPTAALDPISESNMYEEFEKISRGGTTIFISHRLGSTKLADEIFVIDNGKVAESGSHDELMNIDGIYKNMYESQRGWYL